MVVAYKVEYIKHRIKIKEESTYSNNTNYTYYTWEIHSVFGTANNKHNNQYWKLAEFNMTKVVENSYKGNWNTEGVLGKPVKSTER